MTVSANLSELCVEALATLNETVATLQSQIEECGCDEDPCASLIEPDQNLGLHIGAVFIILACSFAGVMLPIVARRKNLNEYPLVLGKHFGTGIILACSYVHMLVPANESLTSECLGSAFTEDFSAYAFLFCLIGIFSMHGLERGIVTYLKAAKGDRQASNDVIAENAQDEDLNAVKSHLDYAHKHGLTSLTENSAMEIRMQAYMLEFGFTVHSIFIGLAVGVENENLVPLLIALSFHQFFEGIGLGSRLCGEGIKTFDAVILGCIFAIAAPIGIMVGTIINTQLQVGGPSFLLTEGIIDALCAGILVYVGFVLLFSDFPRDVNAIYTGPRKGWKAAGLYIVMWSGAGLMTFIGRFL